MKALRDGALALRLAAADDREVSAAVAAWGDDDWRAAVDTLRAHVVLIRAGARCRALGLGGVVLRDAVALEERRVDLVTSLLARIAAALDTQGIGYVLTKALQHFPDMGHDIDLFLPERSPARGDRIVREVAVARPVASSPLSAFAGKAAYLAEGIPLEIHHGRLGHVGEHGAFARALFARRRRVSEGPVVAWVPSPEDQLLLQVVQRVVGHRWIRASDVLRTRALLDAGVDEGYVATTARRAGIAHALRWYRAAVAAARTGVVPLPITAQAYASVGVAAARAGELESLARIAALPALAVATTITRGLPRSRR